MLSKVIYIYIQPSLEKITLENEKSLYKNCEVK